MATYKSSTSQRSLTYWALILLFLVTGGLIMSLEVKIAPTVHSLLDGISTVVLFTAAILVFRAYRKTRAVVLAFVGIGLGGAAILELFHATTATALVSGWAASDATLFMAWSWNAAQIFLALALLAAAPHALRENFGDPATVKQAPMHTPRQVSIFTLLVLPAIIIGLFRLDLPPIYYASIAIPRPPEIISGALFLAAIILFIRKGNWRTDSYGHWIMVGLVLLLDSQIYFMAFSTELFDSSFTAAHVLKACAFGVFAIGFLQAHRTESLTAGGDIVRPRGLGLGVKLAILCGFIGFVCVMPIAIKSSRTLHEIASDNGIQTLSTAAANASGAIEEQRLGVDADLSYLASRVNMQSLQKAALNSAKDNQQLADELSPMIRNLLASDPDYFSIAYVDAASGQAVVRSEQSSATALSLADQQLLESSTQALVAQALSGGRQQPLARSKIFLLQGESAEADADADAITEGVTENTRHRQIEGTALALFADQSDSAIGVFVLQSDVSRELSSGNLPNIETRMYVVNSDGQFILHPDQAKEAATVNETAYTLADEFPGLDFDVLTAPGSARGSIYEQEDGIEILVGVDRLAAVDGAGEPLVYIYTARRDDIEKKATDIGFEQQRNAQTVLLAAILFGWFFARRLAKPVQQISAAAVEYGRSGTVTELPVDGRDEIGMLAKALSDMMASVSSQRRKLSAQADAITRKSEELQAKSDELERKSDELQRSNYDLEQFAYVASHDLKAPLRAIEVLVNWLEEDLHDYNEGDVQENLALLEQRTARLSRLLDDLLAYSRAGRKVGDVKQVDVKHLVEDIATLISPPEGFVIEADDSLPTIMTYHAPLETVFRNLISNAIKHAPEPEKGRIRVSAEDRGDKVEFVVEDNGTGIPAEYAEKVFKMFQTLKARDEMEGSGMGLAIVQRIIDWQGGRIWFHDGPDNKGVVFRFIWSKAPKEMPVIDDAEDDAETQARSPSMEDTQQLVTL